MSVPVSLLIHHGEIPDCRAWPNCLVQMVGFAGCEREAVESNGRKPFDNDRMGDKGGMRAEEQAQ